MSRSAGGRTAPGGSLRYELLLLLASMIWGSTFVAQQIGMDKGLGPMTFNGLRFTIGTLFLIPVMMWHKKRCRDDLKPGAFPYKWCMIAGLFLFAAASFQQVGLLTTSSANAGFITGFYMVFVPLIGIFLGHRAPVSLWVGVVFCLFGFYLLSITGDMSVSKGDLLVAVCAVLWAGQILVIDHVAGKGDSIQIAFIQFFICAVLSLLAAVLFEDWSMSAVIDGAGAVAYAGIMSVGIAFTLQVICQKRCPPGPAAIIMSMEAVFAALTGYFVLNQILTSRAITGCGLILCGMLVVQLVPLIKKKTKKS